MKGLRSIPNPNLQWATLIFHPMSIIFFFFTLKCHFCCFLSHFFIFSSSYYITSLCKLLLYTKTDGIFIAVIYDLGKSGF